MIIEARDIRKSFGDLEVLKGIDFSAEKGEVVSIMGVSGAGKTTLLQILGTLSTPSSGTLSIDGTDVLSLGSKALAAFRGSHIGFVFQFHHLLPEFTAVENVMIPALIAGKSSRQARQEAESLLSQVGLSERLSHKPSQ
ncbi:MAG: ATP-binding cassette domain-containing protein, partial [Bacteroidales bacterium]|nr:ATP-binding cassette domain-containing protein [Bacteroidales bacterium]